MTYFDVMPCDSEAQSRSDGLHSRLFRREPRGKSLGRVALRPAIGDLTLGENAIQKAFAITCNRRGDTRHFGDVYSGSDDHAGALWLCNVTHHSEEAVAHV